MMFSMQLLEKRGQGLSPDNLILWNTLKALYSAFIVAVIILGLGGPTGRPKIPLPSLSAISICPGLAALNCEQVLLSLWHKFHHSEHQGLSLLLSPSNRVRHEFALIVSLNLLQKQSSGELIKFCCACYHEKIMARRI